MTTTALSGLIASAWSHASTSPKRAQRRTWRDSFASNRLFDAAACGARILSDRIDGLEETFSGLVLPFDNEHELARLVTPPYDSFPDNAARRDIATRIIAEHSFDKRAETLIDDAVRRILARG